MKTVIVCFTVMSLLVISVSSSCLSEKEMRPDSVYSLSGETIITLGDTVRMIEDKLGPLPDENPPSLILDADQIIVPVPNLPEEPALVKNKALVFSIIAAAEKNDGLISHDKMVSLLAEHALSLDDLSNATKFLLSKADEKDGVFPVNIDFLKKMYDLDVELRDIQIEAFEKEKQIDYAAGIQDVRSSLDLTPLMISLMFSPGKRSSDPEYSGIRLALAPSGSHRESAHIGQGEYYNAISSHAMEFSFYRNFSETSFSNIEERNKRLTECFENLLSQYKNFWFDETVVVEIHLNEFKFKTFDGDYVGKKLSDNAFSNLGFDGRLVRFFAGLPGVPVELSGDYIKSLNSDEKAAIDGLFSIVYHVDRKGFIKQISYMYIGDWK